MTNAFTPEQEERIREMVSEEIEARFGRESGDALERTIETIRFLVDCGLATPPSPEDSRLLPKPTDEPPPTAPVS